MRICICASNADSLRTASAPTCAGVRLATPHPSPSGVEEVDSLAAGGGGGGADGAAEGGAGSGAASASAGGVAVGFGEELSEMETEGGVSGENDGERTDAHGTPC